MLYGYIKTCSRKCAHRHPDYNAKIQHTNIEKYGTPYTFQSNVVKDKIKCTFKKKYGVEYIGQAKEVKEKIVKTNIERHGCKCVLQSKEVKSKIAKTCLDISNDEKAIFASSKWMKNVEDNVYYTNNPRYFKELVMLVEK